MTETHDDIQSARRTIEKEIDALKVLESELNGDLSKALDIMQNVKGRVIITGMGKSGHIGSKIAATLASTGTPSFFVTPRRSQSRRSGHAHQRRCRYRHL